MNDHHQKNDPKRLGGLPHEQFTELIELLAKAMAEKVAAKLEVRALRALPPTERPGHVQAPSDGRPRLLRIAQVKDRVGMSQTTIYDRIKKGTFPKPVPLGTLVAWLESEIDEWIAARVADRSSVSSG